MADDPLEPMRKLGLRVEEEMAKMGLRLEMFAPIPALHGETADRVQCVFTVDLDELGKDEEQRKFDEQFAQMADDLRRSEEEAKFDAAREDLAEMLRRRQEGGGGILG